MRYIRMLGEDELPPGPRRDFVSKIYGYYEDADFLPAQVISDRCRELADKDDRLRGSASRETVRRMLTGSSSLTSVPTWDNVSLVYRALCDFAGKDPLATYEQEYGFSGSETIKFLDELRNAWKEALKAPPVAKHTGGFGGPVDPWSDEPPF